MRSRRSTLPKTVIQHSKRRSSQAVSWSQRARRLQFGVRDVSEPFSPPEDWHEPDEDGRDYRIIVQSPGEGYRHIVTPDQVRQRLAEMPQKFLRDLEVVQFSQMTRKKTSFPCYGMQWGATIYLYTIEDTFEEIFYDPPKPAVVTEAKMFGGRWDRPSPGVWRLTWSQAAIEDFYLNNILIHELGHLVDDRNTNYAKREQYAEWFAIEYGYRPTRRHAPKPHAVKRRHHRR